LTAREAASALAEGFRSVGAECDEQPVADGGEGTIDVLGGEPRFAQVHDAFRRARRAEWRLLADATAVVEAAQAIPLDPGRLDVRAASSRGLGELIAQVQGADALLVGLGGTANMDAGAGLLEVLDELPLPTRVACDVRTTLAEAPRLFGPQKGASADDVAELERAFAGHLHGGVPGSGAAGGLGAGLASLGAELVPGAELVLDLVGFDPTGYDLVVTGEGTVDETTFEGKAPAVVQQRSRSAGVRCVLFGGRVLAAEAVPLSGDPNRAYADLIELGMRLGRDHATR
jgi:glycerate kinase